MSSDIITQDVQRRDIAKLTLRVNKLSHSELLAFFTSHVKLADGVKYTKSLLVEYIVASIELSIQFMKNGPIRRICGMAGGKNAKKERCRRVDLDQDGRCMYHPLTQSKRASTPPKALRDLFAPRIAPSLVLTPTPSFFSAPASRPTQVATLYPVLTPSAPLQVEPSGRKLGLRDWKCEDCGLENKALDVDCAHCEYEDVEDEPGTVAPPLPVLPPRGAVEVEVKELKIEKIENKGASADADSKRMPIAMPIPLRRRDGKCTAKTAKGTRCTKNAAGDADAQGPESSLCLAGGHIKQWYAGTLVVHGVKR
jgi:hypothetical protein